MLFYDGQDLSATLYTFVYLYEPKLYEENQMVKTFMNSLHLCGYIFHTLFVEKAFDLTEEDFVPSSLSFIPLTGLFNQILINFIDKANEILKSIDDVCKTFSD